MDRRLNICLSRESSEIGEMSDKTGECAEMDWPHPGKEVIDYLEYNTVEKYSTSSINTVISKCKVKKVECIYNILSYDKSTHFISAAGQPSGVTQP